MRVLPLPRLQHNPSQSHHSVMANDIIKQVEPHIREILRLCGVLDAEGRELYKLNELVGRTSKFEEEVVFKTI